MNLYFFLANVDFYHFVIGIQWVEVTIILNQLIASALPIRVNVLRLFIYLIYLYPINPSLKPFA